MYWYRISFSMNTCIGSTLVLAEDEDEARKTISSTPNLTINRIEKIVEEITS